MVRKRYEWADGAELVPHTARKLKILGDYFDQYLRIRCKLPQQSRFRLAVVDGFAGAGRYSKGEAGSPIVLIETLRNVAATLSLKRAVDGMAPLTIECKLILNDADPAVAALLRENIAPILASIRAEIPNLHISYDVRSQEFEAAFPKIKEELLSGGFRNVLFNLDQCGHKLVSRATIDDILGSFRSSEIFLTFMIESLMTFLKKANPEGLLKQIQHLGVKSGDMDEIQYLMSNKEWLGTAERIVFNSFRGAAAYVSPFSIHNPEGWRYWLIHFAQSQKARQVYNDTLHRNSTHQAHFGRSGLNMLTYDPDREGTLYLFDSDGRKTATEQLLIDVPRVISGFGDAISVDAFYQDIYNLTPAHSDDIKSALFDCPDIEVSTPAGSARRRAGTISPNDIIRLKEQRSFHFLWK